jgi:microcystin-dependent protein
MSCTNCFNGCSEITSDKCVKYTGADIPALGIQNGDTLEFVEQTLAQFLISTLNGTGIKPIVDLEGVCSIVANNIPPCVGCAGPTLNDLLQALIDSACDLQDLVNNVTNNLEILEGPYNEGCLTVEETTFSNTHNVLQAVIDQLCQTDQLLTTTILSLNNYVLEDELSNLVVNILEDEGLVGPTTKQYTKMVPYVAYPWFAPSLTGLFDSTGKGIPTGEYENVYLCNGGNPGVPDLRGRAPVGVTDGTMLGPSMDNAVNPSSSPTFNPTYALGTKVGTNFVTLGIPEIPTHTHIVNVDDNKHSHFTTALGGGPFITPSTTNPIVWYQDRGNSETYRLQSTTSGALATVGLSSLSESNITVSLEDTGQSQAHQNNQPTIGCYYIMYIPA